MDFKDLSDLVGAHFDSNVDEIKCATEEAMWDDELFENEFLWAPTKLKIKDKGKGKDHCKFNVKGKRIKRKEPYQRRNY